MPLTLNVDIAKKLGQSDFGSLGAHCNLSVELDPAVLHRYEPRNQRHFRRLFAAIRHVSKRTAVPYPINSAAPVATEDVTSRNPITASAPIDRACSARRSVTV